VVATQQPQRLTTSVMTAHGELRPSAVQDRHVICDACLAEAKAEATFAARTDLTP